MEPCAIPFPARVLLRATLAGKVEIEAGVLKCAGAGLQRITHQDSTFPPTIYAQLTSLNASKI